MLVSLFYAPFCKGLYPYQTTRDGIDYSSLLVLDCVYTKSGCVVRHGTACYNRAGHCSHRAMRNRATARHVNCSSGLMLPRNVVRAIPR